MKKIEISISQFVFILEKLPDIKELLSKNNSSIQISFKDNELDFAINQLSDLFTKIGLQENSEPNDLGYFIESIIDDFSRVFYENK